MVFTSSTYTLYIVSFELFCLCSDQVLSGVFRYLIWKGKLLCI